MALIVMRKYANSKLELYDGDGNIVDHNHIFEPEYHQERYMKACTDAAAAAGAFRLGDEELLVRPITRGKQPIYSDDESDLSSLRYEGMMQPNGKRMSKEDADGNVCALKSNSVRQGYIDFDLARCIASYTYERTADRAGVLENDLLINSTGDGTIGRVAVYNKSFPAVVDGHITIVRLADANLAWYAAAYLMSQEGQDQIYRYINGSSGQVEIYPQDISRIWIRGNSKAKISSVAQKLRDACKKHDEFYIDMTKALSYF